MKYISRSALISTIVRFPSNEPYYQGTAMKIWRTIAQPMMIEAGIDVTELVTQRPQHAFEVMATLVLNQYDAIITVGGDGILFEGRRLKKYDM